MILGIADAQFKIPESNDASRRRYKIASEDEYSGSDDSHSDNLDITYDVVDEVYTHDNVAALQESVGSRNSGDGVPTSQRSRHALTTIKLRTCYQEWPRYGGSSISRRKKHSNGLARPGIL